MDIAWKVLVALLVTITCQYALSRVVDHMNTRGSRTTTQPIAPVAHPRSRPTPDQDSKTRRPALHNATHVLILIAAAVAVAAVLTIGTLAAADLLPSRRRRERSDTELGTPASTTGNDRDSARPSRR